MKKLVLRVGSIVVASMALSACGADELISFNHRSDHSSPIVGGTSDSGDNAVALIMFNDASNPNNSFVCTGTLIAPNVMLTAGHCSLKDETCNGGGGPSTCSANPASGYEILGGTSPINSSTWAVTNPAWTASVTAVHPNPGYGSDSSGAPKNDNAILILGSISVKSGGTMPAPVAWLSATDAAAYATGTSIKAVGYGITNGNTGAGVGTKRWVNLTITGQDSKTFSFGSGSKNTCSGDSGGPAFETINGTVTLIGTTSYGDQSCTQIGVDMRTDAQSSFIGQYTHGTTPTPTPTTTATPSPTPTPSGNDLIVNGTIESTLTGTWTHGGAKSPVKSGIQFHGGHYSMLMGEAHPHGATAPVGDSYSYQEVTIPSSASSATLSFWYWKGTSSTLTSSWQDAHILDTNGNSLKTIFHTADDSETWKHQTVDVSAYIGQTIEVYFNVHENGAGKPSTMFIDDVSLIAP